MLDRSENIIGVFAVTRGTPEDDLHVTLRPVVEGATRP